MLKFDIFWNLYPRKVGKAVAEKKWTTLTHAEQELIMQHLPGRIANDPLWGQKKYIPHPATFINQRLWRDEYQTTAEAEKETPTDSQGKRAYSKPRQTTSTNYFCPDCLGHTRGQHHLEQCINNNDTSEGRKVVTQHDLDLEKWSRRRERGQ